MRRFYLHLLPRGFQKIRHFGLLSNRNRKEKIAAARTLLEKAAVRRLPAATAATPASGTALPRSVPGAVTPVPVPRFPCCGSERLIHLGETPRRIVPVRLPFPDSS